MVDLMSHDREDFRAEMGQRQLGFEPVELEALAEGAGLVSVKTRGRERVYHIQKDRLDDVVGGWLRSFE